jgi:hypothetical protein
MNAMRDRSRLAGFLLAAGALLLMSAADARAQTWCLRQFGSDSQVCVFSSGQQCTSAAVISGGICEREQLGRASAAKPCKPSREAGAARTSRRAAASAC